MNRSNGHVMPMSKMEICLNNKLKWARCGTIAGQRQVDRDMKWALDRQAAELRPGDGLGCLTALLDPGGGGGGGGEKKPALKLAPCVEAGAAAGVWIPWAG